jgi:hypothetical protein
MTELSTEARALLALTRASDGPTDANRRRVAQALAASVGAVGSSLVSPGVAAAAAKSAGTTAAATGVATGSSVLGKVLVSAIVGFGVGVAVAVPVTVVAQKPTEQPQPTTTNAAIAIQSPPGPAGTLAWPAQAPILQRATAPEGSTPRPRASTIEGESSALTREVELLASVQWELNAARGRQALKLLDDYEGRGPASMLAPERAAARVLALCQVGEVAGARQLANEFLRSAPNSPVVPRIRRSCAFRSSQSKAAFAPVTESPGKDH